MPKKVKPPFRADHVGSLLRPQNVKDARVAHKAGKIGAEQLRSIEDAAIKDAVALQRDLGLKAITDGEFRRQSWSADFLGSIGNVSVRESKLSMKFHDKEGEANNAATGYFVDGRLSLPEGIFIEHFKYLKSLVGEDVTPKMTIPSPTLVHFRSGREGIDNTAYPTMEEFYEDLAAIYRQEIDYLIEAGCEILQVDDTNWAYLCDRDIRAQVTSVLGEDPNELAHTYAKLLNKSLSHRAPEMTVYMHVCRGNSGSMWMAEGGYEPVADVIFNEVDVDCYLLEYDTPRAGDFQPLRFVPKGKTVILGLVSSKFPELESKDDLKRRIDEAAKFVPLDQLGLSPQCGFSSGVGGNKVSFDDQRRKLERVVEVAHEVWGAI